MKWGKDQKDILKLSLGLLTLIIVSLSLVYFSNQNSNNQILLFPKHELNLWSKVLVDNLILDLSNNDSVTEEKLGIKFDKKNWRQIENDLQQITVIEVAENPAIEIKNLFQSQTLQFSIINKQGIKTTYMLGDIQLETGNFWMKIITGNDTTYALCQSDISFDGFYQTPLEGKKLSYLQFKNFFVQSFSTWIAQNFWSKYESIALKSGEASLFTIEIPSFNLTPPFSKDTEIDINAVRDYAERFRLWIPGRVEVVSEQQKQDWLKEKNLLIEIISEQQRQHFVILDQAVLWVEKNWLMPITEDFKNNILILRDKFLLNKVVPMAEIWKKVQKDSTQTLTWADLKNKTSKTLILSELKNNSSWKNFFCLLSQCLDEKIHIFMKVDDFLSSQAPRWIQQADHFLEFQGEKFYFKQDPYRLQILTPSLTKFTFITKLDSFYPQSK